MTTRAGLLLGILLPLLSGGLRSEEAIHFELTGDNAASLRLAGAASLTSGERPIVALTDDSPDSLGAAWAGDPVPAASDRILVHFEYSLSVPGPMPERGALGGGVQLIFAGPGDEPPL
ncbi:uncharacterized protein METZ01_LOCUS459582, partial [marine metagenome]